VALQIDFYLTIFRQVMGREGQVVMVVKLRTWFSFCALPRYDVLTWVLRRKDAFGFLLADKALGNSGSKELSGSEMEMLSSVANMETVDAIKFWATCSVVKVLSDWGVDVSVWLHGCMCFHHEDEKQQKRCHLKGRRAVQLACGAWQSFHAKLMSLSLTQQLSELSKLDDVGSGDYKQFLVTAFQSCKAMMQLRADQAWSFWSSFPFAVLQMCLHFVDPDVSETQSRQKAAELMRQFDTSENKSGLGVVPWIFFGHIANRKHVQRWIQGKPLDEHMQQLLFGYSTALVVMQRLEGKHHLINITLSQGRAQHPSAVVAALRRRMNKDLTHPSYRDLLPSLPHKFEDLVPQKWGSRRELLQIVYGYSLDSLHPNLDREEQEMARHSALTDQLHQNATPPKTAAL